MTDAVPLAHALARFIGGLGPPTIPAEVEAKARACPACPHRLPPCRGVPVSGCARRGHRATRPIAAG